MCFLFSGGYYTASSKGNILLPALIRCCFIFAYTACKNAALIADTMHRKAFHTQKQQFQDWLYAGNQPGFVSSRNF